MQMQSVLNQGDERAAAPTTDSADLRADYDLWHQRIYQSDPTHDDSDAPWYRLVREYIGDVSARRVLEIACGRGGYTAELARRGALTIGCDFSSSAIHAAQEKLRASSGSALLSQADAQRLPFRDCCFDLILSCETIEHVPDVCAALREMHRVCKPGGRLLLTTPNYLNLMGLYDLYARFRHPQRKDDQPFDRRQWFPQIHRWIRRAGWTVLATDGTVHQFPIVPRHNPLRWHALERWRTIRKLLKPFAYTYLVLAEKG
jgi:ubiquinone/menaquinone biosynthesis C-methylase UbiE